MFQICGDVEAVGFPVQNVFKMTYGDKNATSEPLNLWTRERLQVLECRSDHEMLNDIAHKVGQGEYWWDNL